ISVTNTVYPAAIIPWTPFRSTPHLGGIGLEQNQTLTREVVTHVCAVAFVGRPGPAYGNPRRGDQYRPLPARYRLALSGNDRNAAGQPGGPACHRRGPFPRRQPAH